MKYKIKFTSKFKKDLKLAKKQGKDVDKLFEAVTILSKGQILDKKFKDHPLSGNYKGMRECHIEPDFLLIYKKIDDILVLSLTRIGTHSDLF
ncbi:MAG: type II toxin-antitoxin system YafQ family toxin [Anaerococcus vaginalis]|uniref:type II toxin-antitoxin system YafQ family toxin n=1 Tax=Anaerococcus vaginalis TaxID=33037 RepID=UPI00291190EC|nr:type II toxin-antitoxin system YafQ family toxin [Anaerococcus vaginalis]MDU7651178.1 type II toxin-antitoxin system YafQ family toxin [Anaerococcus vaginalis]